jgi:hypothetical protein
MKAVLTLVVLTGLYFGVKEARQYFNAHQENPPASALPPAAPQTSGGQLPGLPEKLEPVLESAQQRGASGLHDFLAENAKSMRDPRLAWIQLDYAVLAAPGDLAEARRVFAAVRARLKPDSPVYARMKQLEKTYE